MVTVIIMVGEKNIEPDAAGPNSGNIRQWVQSARRIAAIDLVNYLVGHDRVERLVVISPDALNLPADIGLAWSSKLTYLASPPGPIHVGQQLAQVVAQFQVDKLFYLGGGSAPLLDKTRLSALVDQLASLERGVITNNKYASDWAGITPAAIINEWVERIPHDNMLGWVLSAEAGLPVYGQVAQAAYRLDIDTPTDLLTLRLHPDTSPLLVNYLSSLPLETSPLREALAVLATPASQVFIAGRLSPAPWLALNQATQCWLRVISEERGMVSSGRLDRGQVYSILADYIEQIGLDVFFNNLSQQVQAAFIDTRVMMAHHGKWPSEADRFASDLGLVDQISDAWLQDFTAAAIEAPFPVILGGHGLLTGDLLAFCDLL